MRTSTVLRLLATLALPPAVVVLIQNIISLQSVGWTVWWSVIVIVALFAVARREMPDEPSRSSSFKISLGIIAGLAIVSLIVVLGQWGRYEVWRARQPKMLGLGPGSSHSVVVARFSDLSCALCASLFERYDTAIQRLADSSEGAVKFHRYDVPMEACADHREPSVHCAALATARSAEAVGTRLKIEAAVFKKRLTLSVADLQSAARDAGAVIPTGAELAKIFNSIGDDVELARQSGITELPAYFVNGMPVRLWQDYDVMAFIRHEALRGGSGGAWFRRFVGLN
jgi:hypothetical protein